MPKPNAIDRHGLGVVTIRHEIKLRPHHLLALLRVAHCWQYRNGEGTLEAPGNGGNGIRMLMSLGLVDWEWNVDEERSRLALTLFGEAIVSVLRGLHMGPAEIEQRMAKGEKQP